MKTPMILPRVAHRAGISEERAEALWHEALCYATEDTGWIGTPDYWDVAQERWLALVEREGRTSCLPTPKLSWMVRLQSRLMHLPLIAAEGWSVAWTRALVAK